MMPDLIENLRALARGENSDYSLADEAADEIERLRTDGIIGESKDKIISDMVEVFDRLFERIYGCTNDPEFEHDEPLIRDMRELFFRAGGKSDWFNKE
jgi:hypothetical protein